MAVAAARHDHDSSLDDLVDSLIGDGYVAADNPDGAPPPARAAMAPILDPLVALIRGASSLEDLRDRLAALSPPDEAALAPLQDLLARTTFVGRLAGEVGAETVDGMPPEDR